MIKQPPQLPILNDVPQSIRDYLQGVDDFLRGVYSTLKNFDLGSVALTSGAAVPTGGEDGDLYWRVAGASTALYLNINGAWSAYTNP